VAWDAVQKDVKKVVAEQLKLEDEPEVHLFLRKPTKTMEKYTVMFGIISDKEEAVASVLAEALGLAKSDFVRLHRTERTIEIIPANLHNEFVNNNGDPDIAAICAGIRAMLQDDERFKSLKRSAECSKVGDKGGVQIITAPIRIKPDISDDYVHFWRIHIRVDVDETGKWSIDPRVDVGKVAASNAHDPSKLNFRDQSENTDRKAELRKIRIGGAKNERFMMTQTHYTPAREGVEIVPPEKASNLGKVADDVYEQCKKKLMKE
jgi:hypothetical protein